MATKAAFSFKIVSLTSFTSMVASTTYVCHVIEVIVTTLL